ncbi:MAG TPA: roadblock/LC7 domain-containing protein [Anaerolineaceae bacterium]|nr:roadblock/LC7 domain-containing protein [Anaerolineaceae bacterium]
MTHENVEQLIERLKTLNNASYGLEASMIVSADGLSIASALPDGMEEARISAMSAAMLSLSESITRELQKGSLEQVYIKGENGYVLLMSIAQKAVLTVFAEENIKLGLIILIMKQAVADLEPLI